MKPEMTAAGVEVGCRLLDWDSEFFGFRIARVEPSALRDGAASAVDEWCASHGVACAYLLAGADDQATCDVVQSSGFRLVDVRVTLESVGAPSPPSTGPTVRAARPEDVETLKAIARDSHRDSRFYADGRFDRRRCDELYEVWIAKSCSGWADRVFVAEGDGRAVGYVTCHLRQDEGQIGLVGVSAASRRQGIGRAMIDEARRWFAQQGRGRVSVVTQGRNASGLLMYQRAGMIVRSIQLAFHKWL